MYCSLSCAIFVELLTHTHIHIHTHNNNNNNNNDNFSTQKLKVIMSQTHSFIHKVTHVNSLLEQNLQSIYQNAPIRLLNRIEILFNCTQMNIRAFNLYQQTGTSLFLQKAFAHKYTHTSFIYE